MQFTQTPWGVEECWQTFKVRQRFLHTDREPHNFGQNVQHLMSERAKGEFTLDNHLHADQFSWLEMRNNQLEISRLRVCIPSITFKLLEWFHRSDFAPIVEGDKFTLEGSRIRKNQRFFGCAVNAEWRKAVITRKSCGATSSLSFTTVWKLYRFPRPGGMHAIIGPICIHSVQVPSWWQLDSGGGPQVWRRREHVYRRDGYWDKTGGMVSTQKRSATVVFRCSGSPGRPTVLGLDTSSCTQRSRILFQHLKSLGGQDGRRDYGQCFVCKPLNGIDA